LESTKWSHKFIDKLEQPEGKKNHEYSDHSRKATTYPFLLNFYVKYL